MYPKRSAFTITYTVSTYNLISHNGLNLRKQIYKEYNFKFINKIKFIF